MLTGKLLGYLVNSPSVHASPERPVPLHSFRPVPVASQTDKKGSLVIDDEHEAFNIDLD